MLDALRHTAHSNVSGFTFQERKSVTISMQIICPGLWQRRNRCSKTVDWAGRRDLLCELQCYLTASVDVILDI